MSTVEVNGEIRTTDRGEHIALPSGSVSKFAVGDTVTVQALTALDDEHAEAVQEASEQLAGQTGEVLAAVYLLEEGLFAYHVQLPIGRIEITNGGLRVNNVWPLLERELTTVVANGAE